MLMRRYGVMTAAFAALLCACEATSFDIVTESDEAGVEAEHEEPEPATSSDMPIIPDPCNDVACQNNGECLVREEEAQCFCPSGFTGPMCEQADASPDPCSSVTCQNGGECLVRQGEAQCFCASGFTGSACEELVDSDEATTGMVPVEMNEASVTEGGGEETNKPWPVDMGSDSYGTWATFEVGSVSVRMRQIPAGIFLMGSPESDENFFPSEHPQHQVTLTKEFWLEETEVTQALWEAVMGENPSVWEAEQHPVEQVSWDDVQTFIKKLNTRVEGLNARLPTEAEWEYAARAGTTAPRYGELNDIAWYSDNSDGPGTHPVAQKQANDWGLYDMLGNVLEWCEDWYGDYGSQAVTDPSGPEAGAGRVARGGAWNYYDWHCRAAYRYGYEPDDRSADLGFRLVRGTNLK